MKRYILYLEILYTHSTGDIIIMLLSVVLCQSMDVPVEAGAPGIAAGLLQLGVEVLFASFSVTPRTRASLTQFRSSMERSSGIPVCSIMASRLMNRAARRRRMR